MSTQPAPTPVFYQGQPFGSDLHARWAVFFDTLGERWEYRKHEFDLPYGGHHVPTFWMPAQQFWIDIRPDLPNEEILVKAADLSFKTRCWSYLVWDPIGTHSIYAFNLPFYETGYDKRYVFLLSDHAQQLMVATPLRGGDAYQFIGYSHTAQQMELHTIDSLSNPRLLSAYEAARNASFQPAAD